MRKYSHYETKFIRGIGNNYAMQDLTLWKIFY